MLFGCFIGLMEDQIGLVFLALKDHAMAAVIREKRLLINRPVTVDFSVIRSCNGFHVAVLAEAWTEAVYSEYKQIFGDRSFLLSLKGNQAKAYIDGRMVCSGERGLRIVTDLEGNLIRKDRLDEVR